MNLQMKSRLALMMFLEFFIWGGWYVTVVTWLTRSLHFSDQQAALVSGTTAIGAIVSPFFIGMIADRLVATQKDARGAACAWRGASTFCFDSIGFCATLFRRAALRDCLHADAGADQLASLSPDARPEGRVCADPRIGNFWVDRGRTSRRLAQDRGHRDAHAHGRRSVAAHGDLLP